MSHMMELVNRYIAVRQAAGFSMVTTGYRLKPFARYADARGDTHVRTETAITWAGTAPTARERHGRLQDVITFARYLKAEDPLHELPPKAAFPSRGNTRPPPYIFTPEEIRSILEAAGRLIPRRSSRGDSYRTLFGLLAATGLRIREALRLQLRDLTEDGLVIRETKFRKSRLVFLHESTRKALLKYCQRWRCLAKEGEPLLINRRGKAMNYDTVCNTFLNIVRTLGIKAPPGKVRTRARGARIHDFRHTFAVRALEAAPGKRGAIDRHMVALTTYLGHSEIHSTYWYLQVTPHLMTDIANACEHLLEGRRE